MPVDVCLSLPLIDRVKELSSILARGKLQDLHNSVVLIVDNIFGYSNGNDGWALHSIKEADEPYLFGCIREFLSPNGRFLEALSSRLTLEFPTCKYDFPLWLLSIDSQNTVRSSDCKKSQMCLSLNAFTYYMFAFMCYAAHPKWKQKLVLVDFEDSLYCALFCDYLSFYLFTDPVTVNVMASKMQLSRAGQQIPTFHRSYFNESVGQCTNEFSDVCSSDFRLFWQTEAVLQAICEFLLSWKTAEHSKGIIGLHNNSSGMMVLPGPSNHFQILQQQIIWNKFLNYRKYLYNNQGLIVSSESSIPHHNIMNQFLQFIICCFQHWPFDLSFEVVLETWLSSIQPWRYAQFPQPHIITRFSPTTCDGPLNLHMDINSENYSEWLTFVARHYSLYVGLFLLFLQRVIKIDLRVCRNAHMVYRVAKVFSQDGFKMLLLNAEKLLSEQQQHQHDGSLSTAVMQNAIVSEYHMEQSGLWNPMLIKTVERVLNAMMATKMNLQSELVQKMFRSSSSSVGWLTKFIEWLYSYLILEADNTDDNVDKCISYLTEGIHSFREFFSIQKTFETVHDISLMPPQNGRIQFDDLSASPLIIRPHSKSPPTTSKSLNGNHSDFMNVSSDNCCYSPWNVDGCSVPQNSSSNNNEQLTSLDRFQIIMGLKRPNICRQVINREYGRTMNTSYESRLILTVCSYLEDKFNEKMRQHFIRWCSLSGIHGRIARQILLTTSSSSSQTLQNVNNPRLSFRFLANYYILARLFILYIFCYFLFGLRSPLLYVVCLIVLYLFYEFIKALFAICHEKLKQT
ncbi:Sphingomyelin phosphodiesterase 4 [Schistosoma japonicum]|nr:Sphingomyelin phosphodiesterase 4 [Schistosoma japonicum]